jgi:phosphoserine phosphatase
MVSNERGAGTGVSTRLGGGGGARTGGAVSCTSSSLSLLVEITGSKVGVGGPRGRNVGSGGVVDLNTGSADRDRLLARFFGREGTSDLSVVVAVGDGGGDEGIAA